MKPFLEHQFRTCLVQVFDGWVKTTFEEDGKASEFIPPIHDQDFIDAARYAGYGDAWQHGYEHDLMHAYVADLMGWPHSWSVWAAAHGKGGPRPMEQWSQRVKDEEHLVVSLQRYINTGKQDEYGKLLEAFADRLPNVALGGLMIMRPWLFVGFIGTIQGQHPDGPLAN